MSGPVDARGHITDLRSALTWLEDESARIEGWGAELAGRLSGGARLLTVGNGGSAAHAEHLASEFVGRYAGNRAPFSAVALHVDGAALTALVNDYGIEHMFTRQVEAHGRPGDVLIALSTSGRSPNVVAAAQCASRLGLATWALTGPAPNPLAQMCDDSLAVAAGRTATVQEIHQVAIHLLCASFDAHLPPVVTSIPV